MDQSLKFQVATTTYDWEGDSYAADTQYWSTLEGANAFAMISAQDDNPGSVVDIVVVESRDDGFISVESIVTYGDKAKDKYTCHVHVYPYEQAREEENVLIYGIHPRMCDGTLVMVNFGTRSDALARRGLRSFTTEETIVNGGIPP